MKLRIVWIAGLLLAALGQAHAANVLVVSFGSGAPRCTPPGVTGLTFPACAVGTSFQSYSFSWGASFISPGGVSLSDLSMLKNLDDSSAALLMDLLVGGQIPAMRFTIYALPPGSHAYTPVYEILMQRVYVTALSDGDSGGGGPPTQAVSVTAGSVSVSVTTFDANGVASTTTATYPPGK